MRIVVERAAPPPGCPRARASRPRAPSASLAPTLSWSAPPRRSGRRRCRPGSARSSAPGRSSRSRRRGCAPSRARRGLSRSRPSKTILLSSAMWPGSSTRRIIESAVTDLPLPDSPTTPSVRPASISKSTPSTARIGPRSESNHVRRFSTRSSAVTRGAGVLTAMCRSSAAAMTSAVARLQRRQQLPVLLGDRAAGRPAAVAEEVRADPRRDRAPDLRRVRLARALEHELVEADVGLDRLLQVVRPRRLAHHPDLLRELGEVRVVHPLDRLREAELLERQADRDQDLVHLLVGDAEHDGAAVRVRDDESLVLELPQRLAHRAAARLQLARDPVLDQPLAVLELADDDRLAQRLDAPARGGPARGCGLIRQYC